jgi:photosystem II stability/assembly factor-like uncharacterized protein
MSIISDPTNSSVYWTGGYYYTTAYYMSVGKSTNGGVTWTHSTISGSNAYLRCMALDPAHPDTVYAGGYEGSGSAIYRTVDGGTSWTKLTTTAMTNYVYAIAVSPVSPATILAATGGGIYRSTDFGASWTKMSSSIGTCYDILIDPQSPTRIWLGTYSQGVYQSLDGGATWTAMNAGLGDLCVNKLALNPSSWLFAGTDGAAMYRWSLSVGTEEWESAPVETPGLVATPNPAVAGASIRYSLQSASEVVISVFDIQGRLVGSIDDGYQPSGEHEVWWSADDTNGSPLAPGMYFIRLVSGSDVSTGSLVLIE